MTSDAEIVEYTEGVCGSFSDSEKPSPDRQEFTPGPWGWYSEDNSMAILCGDGGADPFEKHVMAVSPCKSCQDRSSEPWTWGRCQVPKAPDALLIAAAPELYEALEGLLEDAARQMKNPSHHMPFNFLKAKKALAKARPPGAELNISDEPGSDAVSMKPLSSISE
ncbi:MAG: hypothetical protein JSR78_10550 [Proteobacteria bacterium]|nr:hypothetical protein [Pseudomonadota bacterium]